MNARRALHDLESHYLPASAPRRPRRIIGHDEHGDMYETYWWELWPLALAFVVFVAAWCIWHGWAAGLVNVALEEMGRGVGR